MEHNDVEFGVFIPIGNNGWLISEAAPQYMPTFELNLRIVELAERHGLDFALCMVKLRGFGGATEYWDYNLEPFTLMAGLAARTERIRLYASVPILVLPPAITARMAVTIDSIAPDRFGLNIVTGWQRAEYEQMGVWPGDEYYDRRYDYAGEYISVMRELWETGESSFQGEFFRMDDCRVKPLPTGRIRIVCAGQSNSGIDFCSMHGDYNFIANTGENSPQGFAELSSKVQQAAERSGRDVGVYVYTMILARETAAEAHATWKRYQDGADIVALSRIVGQASLDSHSRHEGSGIKGLSELLTKDAAAKAVNWGASILIGSYEEVAGMLDQMASVPGVKGIMMTFDDFLDGLETFGTRIKPLMRSHLPVV